MVVKCSDPGQLSQFTPALAPALPADNIPPTNIIAGTNTVTQLDHPVVTANQMKDWIQQNWQPQNFTTGIPDSRLIPDGKW